jgi:hypothetical protein
MKTEASPWCGLGDALGQIWPLTTRRVPAQAGMFATNGSGAVFGWTPVDSASLY